MIVNTVTLEGTLTADPVIADVARRSRPISSVVMNVEQRSSVTRSRGPMAITVVARDEVADALVATTRFGYIIRVVGHLEALHCSTDDGLPFTHFIVVASSFEVTSDVPF